jgi:hypothetical protein
MGRLEWIRILDGEVSCVEGMIVDDGTEYLSGLPCLVFIDILLYEGHSSTE